MVANAEGIETVEAHQITGYDRGRHVMRAGPGEFAAGRAGRYVRSRTASELRQATGELAIAQAQAPSGSLAAALIAAYAQAIITEAGDAQ